MKKQILSAALLFAAASLPVAQATTLTFSAVPTARTVVDSSGFTLAGPDKLVLVGTFDNLSFALDPNISLAANFEAVSLAGGWKQFGLDTATLAPNAGVTSTLGLSATGKIGGSVTDNTFGSTKADAFNDKAIYVWVFNGSSIETSTQAGLFNATTATIAWTSPVNAGGVADSRTFSTTASGASVIQAVGGFGSTTGSQLQLTNSFAAVPEPSTWAAAVLGFLVLGIRAIRKNRSRSFPALIATALAVLAGGQAHAARNILVLVADDLGADSSSLTNSVGPGVRLAETPVIDSLAQNGVVFTRAYARPSCSATRATLLTGRHAFRTGVGTAITGTLPELRDDEYTVARAFAAQAPQYHVASFGKWHLGNGANTPLTKGGWQFYAGVNGPQPAGFYNWTKIKNGVSTNSTTYITTDQVNETVDWITAQGSAPWLAWVSFTAPHSPYAKPPAELLSPRFADLTGTSADINARQRDYYEASLEALDKEIGRLLASVDRSNTDIIFVGDNGTPQAVVQAPYNFPTENHAKFTLFEGGVRVPLVISGPSVGYVGRNNSVVSTVDLFQLVQELAGIDVAKTLPPGVVVDSKSILPALKSNVTLPTDLFVDQFNRGSGASTDGQSILDERYKLIRFDSKNERFYDLESDPYENTNLLAAGSLTADAQAHYNSLKHKIQHYVALTNTARTRDAFPFPVHRGLAFSENSATVAFDYTPVSVPTVYTLWRTADVNNPLAWQPVSTLPVAAVATPSGTVSGTLTDPAAPAGKQYYQVVPSLW